MRSSWSCRTGRSPSTSRPPDRARCGTPHRGHDAPDRAARGHALRPHTADAAIAAWAPSLAETLEEAAQALAELAADIAPGARSGHEETVTLESHDLEALVVAWLNELIGLIDVHGALVRASADEVGRSPSGGGWLLRGRASFVRLGGRDAVRRHDVKSATYHGLRVSADDHGRWSLWCVVDV